MQLNKPSRNKQVKISHNETESKIKSQVMVTWAASYRQEAMELTPLHMGHCIVMGEALLVAVVSQVASRIGTYSHFIKSCQTRPAACRTCSCPTSETLKQQARQRGAATCYTWCHTTPKKYKDLVRRQIWRDAADLCFMEDLRKTIHWGYW